MLEQILSPEQISIKIGILAVENPMFLYEIYAAVGLQVDKMRYLILNVNQFLITLVLHMLCFAHLFVSERCRRLKTDAIGKLEQPTNTTGQFLTE